jgi:hypothetical protein
MDEQLKAELAEYDPKELLLFVLEHYKIEIWNVGANRVEVEGNFSIEIEGVLLYKLYWENMVLAPYNDLDELCATIVMELHRE